MKAQELLLGLEYEVHGADLSREITGICKDTGSVEAGCLFVCICGTRFDSHAFARQVVADGAALVVCQTPPQDEIPYVLVSDTRQALSVIYANYYGNPERKFTHVIGITGTNGKTSTSMMARAVFEAAGHRVGLIGTTKYVVGEREYDAPLTTPAPEDLFRYFAEMIEAGCDTLIMEVSSHALSQKRVEGIPFTVGVFTNLTQDHLDYHGTMEAYRREKEKLFSLCRTGLVNRDDPAAEQILSSAACKCYTYGTGNADFAVSDEKLSVSGVQYRLRYEGKMLEISLPIPGRFSVYNSAAAAAAALLSGIPEETVTAALGKMHGVPGRVERLPDTGDVTVLLDYAHTPDALENVLSTLSALPHGKIYTVFGCGGDRDPKKRPMMGEIACQHSDCVLVTSDNPRTEDPEAIIRDILAGCENSEHLFAVITDRTEAIRHALKHAEAGDVVLLAGKGHEEYIIDKDGKRPYSEKEVVRQFYTEKKEGRTC